MWLTSVAELLCLVAVGQAAEPAAPAAKLPEPITTRQTTFFIPFHLQASPDLAEVLLYVSIDRGANWQLYSRLAPAQKQFTFRAGGDGEYWFLVRTMDRRGKLQPEGPNLPELRVVVNTAPARRSEGDSPVFADTKTGTVPNTKTGTVPDPAAVASRTAGYSSSPKPATTGGAPSTSWPAERSPAAVAVTPNPAIRNQYVPPDERGSGSGVPGLPPGEKPRMVNSRLFELVYDDDSVRPAGGSRVELWCTKDGGQTWKNFTINDDCRKPFVVSVDAEGMYGFRAVSAVAGPGGAPPRSGDLPEVWIGVDLTKPVARITTAGEGTGAEAGNLSITWEATDQALAPRPISLMFSENQGGPWTTIAAGLENTGRYSWAVPTRLPQRIYLRLEARDEAGNVGTFESSEPVILNGFHPSVRVRR
jgi:hypothetical protein